MATQEEILSTKKGPDNEGGSEGVSLYYVID